MFIYIFINHFLCFLPHGPGDGLAAEHIWPRFQFSTIERFPFICQNLVQLEAFAAADPVVQTILESYPNMPWSLSDHILIAMRLTKQNFQSWRMSE